MNANASGKPGHSRRGRSAIVAAIMIVAVGTILNLAILPWRSIRTALPPHFDWVDGDLGFATWTEESEMRHVMPPTLFVYINGEVVGTILFKDAEFADVESVGIADAKHRPWIHAVYDPRLFRVNVYDTDDRSIDAEPITTFEDRDGDGMIDRKMDWQQKQWLMLRDETEWIPVESEPIKLNP